jgi:hypothetical protein
MAELKTKVTNASVTAFINSVSDPVQRADAKTLLALLKKITKEKPKLWGRSIVGFGKYHYTSERSAQEGDWPLVGFSPRKQNLTLYIMRDFKEQAALLKRLGKYKSSVGCLYIKRLADIDQTVLAKLIERSFQVMKKKFKA